MDATTFYSFTFFWIGATSGYLFAHYKYNARYLEANLRLIAILEKLEKAKSTD